jgi:hypothetical protein
VSTVLGRSQRLCIKMKLCAPPAASHDGLSSNSLRKPGTETHHRNSSSSISNHNKHNRGSSNQPPQSITRSLHNKPNNKPKSPRTSLSMPKHFTPPRRPDRMPPLPHQRQLPHLLQQHLTPNHITTITMVRTTTTRIRSPRR